MPKKETILIKISGASLKAKENTFDITKIKNITAQIKKIQQTHNVAIVVGGGNIFRGNLAEDFNVAPTDADYMGMLATIMNGIILQNNFELEGVKCKLFSALEINSVCSPYIIRKATKSLEDGFVSIFVAGTGSPFVTTDTGATLRACQIGAKTILMGKNGVDGVYDKDPKKHSDAKKFDKLTYREIFDKDLKVMDLTSLSLCQDHNIKLVVFNIDEKNSIINVMDKKTPFTLITKE